MEEWGLAPGRILTVQCNLWHSCHVCFPRTSLSGYSSLSVFHCPFKLTAHRITRLFAQHLQLLTMHVMDWSSYLCTHICSVAGIYHARQHTYAQIPFGCSAVQFRLWSVVNCCKSISTCILDFNRLNFGAKNWTEDWNKLRQCTHSTVSAKYKVKCWGLEDWLPSGCPLFWIAKLDGLQGNSLSLKCMCPRVDYLTWAQNLPHFSR